MNNKKKRKNLIIIENILALFIFLFIAVFIEGMLSVFVLKRDISGSTDLFIAQVETVLQGNEEAEQVQLEELKDSYITEAKAAAYIISNKYALRSDVEELKGVANLLSVDEIHIFNSNGKIIGGTNTEYYGYSFDSGAQMSFFKPMLDDKSLSMCQDVTPNTAVGKNMMYAITWDASGQFMVQVGVEPKRLLEVLKSHKIENVINSIPITEGYDIYAINKDNVVVASSNKRLTGKPALDSICSLFFAGKNENYKKIRDYDNEYYYVNYQKFEDGIIGITYNLRYSNNALLMPIVIILAYMFLAGVTIMIIIAGSHRLKEKKNEDIMKQYRILASIADVYYSMHLIDLVNDTVEEFKSQGAVKTLSSIDLPATKLMYSVMNGVTDSAYLSNALEFTDLTTVADRMGNQKIISGEFVGKNIGWFRASFIMTEEDENHRPTKVLYITRSIDAAKKKEERLIIKSNTDELTGSFNRRAYEDNIKDFSEHGFDDISYISIDVNGLKSTNDNLGHSAGDELIIGAAECINKSLGKYGQVFRIGGDEFVALIKVKKEQLEGILKNLETTVNNWHGELVDNLSLSYGVVSAFDNPTISLQEIAILADKKMYEAKAEHYRTRGTDRRGNREAHTVLSGLYTKILKVNLTTDSYQIVDMDATEQTEEKGFSGKISEWLSEFGKTGQVHPDDLNDYLEATDLGHLRDYFKNNSSYRIFYRRKYGNEYESVMMEIVTANDYKDDDQNVFLYVKNIEK